MKNTARILGILIISAMILLSGCTQSSNEGASDPTKLQVIATLFPQYDFVRQIGQDKVKVRLILPPGVEAHSFEPTPQDVVAIQKSDLFIYTGSLMEPWAHRIIEGIGTDKTVIVDVSSKVTFLDEADEDDDQAHSSGANGDSNSLAGKDPHIWTDPQNAILMVDTILEGMISADPQNADYYKQNAKNYMQKLTDLDQKIASTLATVDNKTIIYGGHFAFGYFAHRYGLGNVSPYSGFAPDAEPTPQKIAEMIKLMNQLQEKAVFYEELIDPKVARVIAEETGAEMLLLHGAHNVSKDELSSGVTYIDIMEGNLERLKAGLTNHE